MSEPSLHELQQWMKAKILSDPSTGLPEEQSFLNAQRDTPGLERLTIYAGGYLERTREALADVYEAVEHVLGPRRFTELARAYASRYASHDYNLSLRGRHLPEFLAQHTPSRDLPFLPDLARLEWLICLAFHAFDEPPSFGPAQDGARVTGLSLDEWDRAHFAFQPSVGCVASAWPIRDVWEARARPVADVNIDLVNRPQRVLVFRRDTHVVCELLDEGPHRVLEALLSGRTLGDVCRELAEEAREPSPEISAWFSHWVQNGLVIRIF